MNMALTSDFIFFLILPFICILQNISVGSTIWVKHSSCYSIHSGIWDQLFCTTL